VFSDVGWIGSTKNLDSVDCNADQTHTVRGPSHIHGLARRKPHGYKPCVSVVNPYISVDMTVVFRDEP